MLKLSADPWGGYRGGVRKSMQDTEAELEMRIRSSDRSFANCTILVTGVTAA